MDNKIFNRAINAYKVGNAEPLNELIPTMKELDGYEWYSVFELMQEERVFNMPMGSHYISETLPIFIQALEKANKEHGRLDSNKKFGMAVLAEEPEIFNQFINLYVYKAITKTSYTLSSSLLSIDSGKKEGFWEGFFLNYLESFTLEEFSDKQVHNIATNTNKIFDLDKSQHKNIAKYIECDTNYPTGKVVQNILDYVINFDKISVPQSKINRMGRTEDKIEMCKKFFNILEKVDLEIELEESKIQLSNKSKPKL